MTRDQKTARTSQKETFENYLAQPGQTLTSKNSLNQLS